MIKRSTLVWSLFISLVGGLIAAYAFIKILGLFSEAFLTFWLVIGTFFGILIYLITYAVLSVMNNHAHKKKMIEDEVRRNFISDGQKAGRRLLTRNVGKAAIKYEYAYVEATLSSKIEYPYVFIGKSLKLQIGKNGSVKLYDHSQYVGKVTRGSFCSVAAQWIREDLPVRACIMDINEQTWTGVVHSCFYKDELSERLARNPDAPEYKLIGSRSRERQLRAALAVVGEKCELDIDEKNNRVIVYNRNGEEYGALPPTAIKDFKDEDVFACDCYISNITFGSIIELHVRLF